MNVLSVYCACATSLTAFALLLAANQTPSSMAGDAGWTPGEAEATQTPFCQMALWWECCKSGLYGLWVFRGRGMRRERGQGIMGREGRGDKKTQTDRESIFEQSHTDTTMTKWHRNIWFLCMCIRPYKSLGIAIKFFPRPPAQPSKHCYKHKRPRKPTKTGGRRKKTPCKGYQLRSFK